MEKMKLKFLTFKNQKDLIDGIVLRKLVINRDHRGLLVETLRKDWTDVFNRPINQFGQSYCSVTLPGFARDEGRWHNHPTKQVDRFVVLRGSAVVALYDCREGSKTYGKLNLFLMGEKNGDDDQYLLLIPQGVYHGFCTVGKDPCYLISFPNHHYDPSEEERISFAKVNATFPDGTAFSWEVVRKQFSS